jgi:DmsE family decaheme c-type cytochrome
MRKLVVLWCVPLLLAIAPLYAQKLKVGDPGYLGDAVCQTCHPDLWGSLSRNPHFKIIVFSKPVQGTFGCESCHGPGGNHPENPFDHSRINRIQGNPPKQVLDTCLACHAKDFTKANVRRSMHSTNDVVCTDCHAIHSAKTPKYLLARTQRELCYECHLEAKAQFDLPFHHRVNEGAINCTDCHNPHGAFTATWRGGARPRMVSESFGNDESCLKCHTDKRGPFVYEHPPVRIEGCEVCHNPHGSANPRLLKRPAVFTMCLECHTGVAGFGKTGFGEPSPIVPFHRFESPQFQNCVTCHVRIHGSNVDRRFQR